MIDVISSKEDDISRDILKYMLVSEGFCLRSGAESKKDKDIKILLLGKKNEKIEVLKDCRLIVHHDYDSLNDILPKTGVTSSVDAEDDWRIEKLNLPDNKNYPVLVDFTTDIEKNIIISTDKTPLCIRAENTSVVIVLFDFLTISTHLLSGLSHILRERGLLEVPLFNLYSSMVANSIEMIAREQNIPLVRKKPWPKDYRFAVALTHDVERIIPTPTTPLDRLKKRISKETTISPIFQFKIFQDIEQKLAMNSTYFFLDNTSFFDSDLSLEDELAREVIDFVLKGGNEIGLHGSFFSYSDPDMLITEKTRLENASGVPVKGIRQHYLNMDVPYTWQIQESTGLLYDSTLGYNDKIGFRAGCAYPFKPLDLLNKRILNLWQVPLIIMDVVLFREKPWLSLSPSEALERSNKILDILEDFSGGASILWHPEHFNDEHYTSTYEKVLLEISRKKGWATTCENLIRWWEFRNNVEIEIEEGSDRNLILNARLNAAKEEYKAISDYHLPIDIIYKGKIVRHQIPLNRLLAEGEYRMKV